MPLHKNRPSFMLSLRLFYLSLLCILLLGLLAAPFSDLWADRIHLIDGKTIKGTVQKFGRKVWEVQKRDGSIEKVPRYKILDLVFNESGVERGYDRFFFRFFTALGSAEYAVEVRDKRQNRNIVNPHPPLRAGLEVGYMVTVYKLAVHGGFEYSHANFYSTDEPSYNYNTLTLGAIYYPHLWDWNFYLNPQLRLPLNGSFSFPQEDLGSVSIPIENGGLGYGLHIGYERHLSDSTMWSVALSYTSDNLKVSKQVLAEDVSRLPGDVEVLEDQTSKVDFIGLSFIFTYD